MADPTSTDLPSPDAEDVKLRRHTTAGLPLPNGTSAEDAVDAPSELNKHRPMMERLETAPAAPNPIHPLLARRSNGQTINLNRQITYDFDEYGTSSESSSEDEDETNISPSLARVQTPMDEPPRKRRRGSESGPYSKFSVGNQHFRTKGRVSRCDGRLKISVHEAMNTGYLAKALGGSVKNHLFPISQEEEDSGSEDSTDDESEAVKDTASVDDIFENEATRPRMNIVIIVIGSRGDIQPFLKIGKILQDDYGHRVRIATHPAFKDFIEKDVGLEFFSVGGNPSELMAFMVKNPGLVPSLETVKAGEIGRRRASMYEMFQGMWRACVDATESTTSPEQTPDGKPPFIADAIIANPPSFAHVHIAERLGIPLHIMFTFPYSPTTEFPHPLANIKQSNVDRAYTNFMSYPLVEMMTWQGLGDLVNKFRIKSLGLEPVSTLWAPGMLYRLEVPHTYLWSPSLVPKPHDWGPEIDIAGFVFLALGSSFTPPDELAKFLDAGEPPVYIGFGSIVVDDPNKFTDMIFSAVKEAGVRALVSKGWGGFGGDGLDVPENIFLLENTPHDWLFPKCSAVVHHGGAGTTAIGLKCGRPTMIVPFFGDQPFWGNMVAKAKAGAFDCIPYKKLTVAKLANGIRECLTDEAKENVMKISESIGREGDGALNAVRSFHRSLPIRGSKSMRCSILEERTSVWRIKGTHVRLCTLAAEMLVKEEKLRRKNLTLLRHMEWNDFEGPGEPITGVGMAALRTMRDTAFGVGSIPVHFAKVTKKRGEHEKKKRRRSELLARREADAAARELNKEDGPASNDMSRQDTQLTALSADPSRTLASEFAQETEHGVGKTLEAIARMPMELSLAVAQGFHNAPRLYGDETVRRPRRITGMKSGLRAGRDEFTHGVSDAFSGLVRLPARGMKENGALGLLEGFGMGIGGLVLKNIAAFVSPWPFAAKGMEKEWRARWGQPGTNIYIKKARMIQGLDELQQLQQLQEAREKKHALSKADPSEPLANTDARPQSSDVAVRADGVTAREENVDESRPLPSREDLGAINGRVRHAWSVIAELLEVREQVRDRGFMSRMRFLGEKKKWKRNHALESVATVEAALNARRNGLPLDEAMRDHRREVERAKLPRKPGMVAPPHTNGHPKLSTNDASTSEKDKNRKAEADISTAPSRDDEGGGRDRSTTETTDFAMSTISGAVD